MRSDPIRRTEPRAAVRRLERPNPCQPRTLDLGDLAEFVYRVEGWS
jgi:hypothetical protein